MAGTDASDLVEGWHDRRKLITVVYADMVGYSRLIGIDDAGTLARLRALRRALIDPAIEAHGGRIVQTSGDAMLIEFDSIEGAVRCAVKVQRQVPIHDGEQDPDRTIRFRIGINIGDVIDQGHDLHGDAVNVAVRLQAECPPGGICVSRSVRDHVCHRLDLVFDELGTLSLKNIAHPVEAFVVRPEATSDASKQLERSIGDDATEALPLTAAHYRLGSSGTIRPAAARLSIVVLPFVNLGGDPQDEYLADGITDDLTGNLSRIPDAFVIARASAYAYRNKAADVRTIGRELGVRYIVEGGVRKIANVLRVSVQLISVETGGHIWSDRFDEEITNLAVGQEVIVCKLASALGIKVIDVESARSAQERPTSPDVLDLVLRARSLENQPATMPRIDAAQKLYEQALAIDPSSLRAILGLFRILFVRWTARGYWQNGEMRELAIKLLATAQSIAPHDEEVMVSTVRLLQFEGRWSETMACAQRVIDNFPNSVYGYLYLARGKIFAGKSEEALPLLAKTIQLNPREPYLWDRYWRTGFALQLIGRYEEAIVWHQRALAVYPDAPSRLRGNRFRDIAAALALSGRIDEARCAIAEGNRIWPFATVRGIAVPDTSCRTYVEQIRRYQEGLRLAGLRDHAEEDAEFGVLSDDVLREDPVGFTPKAAPGVTALRTAALQTLLQEQTLIVVDTTLYSWGQSIPGAFGLKDAGIGGSLSDSTQARLNRTMLTMTGGDLDKPIVAVGWNSEHFDGRNLALRLASLGYAHVFWYRGGREWWEAHALPETALALVPW
jgi:TolB-like protein/class 3 adenylate cyclase